MSYLTGIDALNHFSSKLETQEEDCVLFDGDCLYIYQSGKNYFHKWYLLPCRNHHFFRKIDKEDVDFIYSEELQVLTKEDVSGFYNKHNQSIFINGRFNFFQVELDSYDFHPETDIKELEREYKIRNMAVMKVMCPILEKHLGFKEVFDGVLESEVDQYIEQNPNLF